MQGKQTLNESLFVYNLNIETFVPETHILRKIHQIIDLSFIRNLTKEKYCLDNGRPSVDPELFFRMMLLKYLYNIDSERRLCEDTHSHMGYRWFCRLSIQDPVPHHSTLTKIRDRLGEEVIESFFDEIVDQCRQHGLVHGKRIITDGTLIKANAALNSLEATNLRDHHMEILREKEYRNNPDQKRVTRKLSNKTHLSRTDPDSTLAYKQGTPKGLKYKGHFSIDAAHGIILDPFISTGADHEAKHYIDRLETIEKKYEIKIEEAVADRGYGSGRIISALYDRNIRPLIPLFHHSSGSSMPKWFEYDKESDTIKCPTGNTLVPVGNKDTYNRQWYIIKGDDCLNCKEPWLCTARHIPTQNKPRFIQRSQYQDYFDRIIKEEKTKYFRQAVRERFYKVEGIFSEAKRLHGFSKAQFRGRKKVQMQAFFTASVLNIKKLVKLAGKYPKMSPKVAIIEKISRLFSFQLTIFQPKFVY